MHYAQALGYSQADLDLRILKLGGPETRIQLLRLCVPTSMRQDLIKEFHCNESGGHRGVRQTEAQMQRRFYWPGMHRDIELYIAGCDECGISKSVTQGDMGRFRLILQPGCVPAPRSAVTNFWMHHHTLANS